MNTPASVARVLNVRGITGEARTRFLSPTEWSQIERSETLPGLASVVTRIHAAVVESDPSLLFVASAGLRGGGNIRGCAWFTDERDKLEPASVR